MTAFAHRMDGVTGSAIRELFKLMADPEIISFGGGNPCRESFPSQAVSGIAAEALASDGATVLQYGATEGYLPLRESYLQHIAAPKGVQADIENVLITHGSMQGLDLLTKVLVDPGDAVLVESPTFLGALQGFQTYQANRIPVEMDDDGVIIEDLEEKMKKYRPKMFYCIPTFQNPTGKTLSLERRRQVAQLAEKYDVIVAEDDPYCDLRFRGEALPPIKTFDESGHVVLLNSFSKILSPGIRVGVAVGEPALIRKMTILKQCTDTHTSNLSQVIAHEFLKRGLLPGHLTRIIPIYRERLDAMLAGLDKYFPKGCTFTRPKGGLFVWCALDGENWDIEALAARAAQEIKVAFVPGKFFYVDPAKMGLNTMRLNFSAASPERIDEGVKRLGTLISNML